ECFKRIAERHRQLFYLLAGFHRLVDVALLRLARIELVLEAVIHRLDQNGCHEMRVHHGIDGAVFETAGSRDAKPRGADLEAAIGEYRRPETRIPEATIGVDGRAADGGQAAKMLDDAADGLKSDLARQLNVIG